MQTFRMRVMCVIDGKQVAPAVTAAVTVSVCGTAEVGVLPCGKRICARARWCARLWLDPSPCVVVGGLCVPYSILLFFLFGH